jgi:LmbE family N-acetylglucosaminyl deacetylase
LATIAFFQPHPDDLELNCGQILHYLAAVSRKEHRIVIASTTRGEFGLPGAEYDKFKGEFLGKYREKELIRAMAIHGISAEKITFFGYIDGFVPFNRGIVAKILDFLRQTKPDIIFAPEPLYTYYVHRDHVNTTRALVYIIHHRLIDYIPRLYVYNSLCPNFFFPFKKEQYRVTDQLLACHKTQFWLLNKMKLAIRPLAFYFALKIRGWRGHYAEPFRRIYFLPENRPKNAPSLWARCVSHFCWAHLPWFDAQYPAALMEKVEAMRKKQKL